MALPSNGVSASPFVGLPVDGGLTAPEHADALDRQTFSPTLKSGGQFQSVNGAEILGHWGGEIVYR